MKCPMCNATADVMETRQSELGKRRRYQCFNNHRFTTLENVAWLKGKPAPTQHSTSTSQA